MNLRIVVPTLVFVTLVAVCTTSSFAGVSLGVFLDGALDAQIAGFFNATKPHAIVQYALVWSGTDASAHTTLMNRVASHGATPMCVWGTYNYSFDQIINGSRDAYIQDVADRVKTFNKPVILAFCAEFNLSSSPYYGNPTKYVQMWRHVRDIFTARGATKAQWAFCPNYQSTPGTDYSAYYPGDAYVDWVGSLGTDTNWSGGGSAGLSFNTLFGLVLADQASRYPHKPQIVMWFATAGDASYKANTWIPASYSSMAAYPNLRAVVWYNANTSAIVPNTDYRVWDTSGVPSTVTTAYKNAVSSSVLFLTYLPPYADLVPGGGGGTLDITPVPSTVARGTNITINYAFTGITQRVDAYLGVVMTDGSLLVMDPSQNFQSNIVPVAANYDVSGNPSGGLTFTVPTTIPTGVYTFEAVWVPAGTPVTDTGMDVAPVTVH